MSDTAWRRRMRYDILATDPQTPRHALLITSVEIAPVSSTN